MNFHHLAYWQDKALSLAIENRLFINGEYTAAAENETFETVDPVTQAPLANIARGKSVDIDRAVSAARGVFERGDWSLSSPAKRKAVLNKLADLMEAHAEELALLETLDTGKPIRHSLRDDIPGAARAIRYGRYQRRHGYPRKLLAVPRWRGYTMRSRRVTCDAWIRRITARKQRP